MRHPARLYKLLLVALFILMLAGQAHAVSAGTNKWTTNGPPGPGGNVQAIAIDPATPSTLYAATSGSRVWISTNAGGSWKQVNNTLTNNVAALAIDPTNPLIIYAGADNGVYESTNGGGTWGPVNNGLTNHTVSALAIDSASPTTIYAGTGGGVFVSTSGGSSWSPDNGGLPPFTNVLSLAIDPQSPGILYAGTHDSGVYKSSGGDWVQIDIGLTAALVDSLAIDPKTTTTLYAGTDTGGAYKSTNGGGSWSPINTGLVNSGNPALKCWVAALAVNPATPGIVYAGTEDSGVFKSTDGGSHWNAFNTGLTSDTVTSIAINPQAATNLFAGTFGNGVFSINQGNGSPYTTYLPVMHRS